jgi:hypothetical protein
MAPWGFKFADIQIPVQLWHGKHDKAVRPNMANGLRTRSPVSTRTSATLTVTSPSLTVCPTSRGSCSTSRTRASFLASVATVEAATDSSLHICQFREESV